MTTTTNTPESATLEATKKDVSASINLDDNMLTIEFGNGAKLEIYPNEYIEVIQKYATLHGLKQKLIDAAAISRNTTTGKSATIEDKYNAVVEVYDRLLAGHWNKLREAGSPKYGLLLEALIRLYPKKTEDELKAYLESKSKEQTAALKLNTKISRMIEKIKLERAGDIDTKSLLDELGE